MIDIRSIRNAAGLSQSDIARGLGLSDRSGTQTVSQMEARKDWLLSTVAAYAKAAGADSALLVIRVSGEYLEFDLL